MYSKTRLAGMKKQEIVQIARDDYGLDVVGSETKEVLVDQIVATQREIEGEDAQVGPDVGEQPADPVDIEKDRVRVKFHATSGIDGAAPVVCSLNGRAYRIQRGVEVSLPRAVLRACIDDAVQEILETVMEGGQSIVRSRFVPRFSYQVII